MVNAVAPNFGAIAQSAAIGLAVMDAEGTVRSANDAFCRMLGCTEAELAGHPLEAVIAPEDRLLVRSAVRPGRPVECLVAGCKGRTFRARLTRFEMRDDGEQATLLVMEPLPAAPPSPIASSRHSEISEEKFRWILEASPIGVVETNFRGQVTRANDACLRLLGFTREEFLVEGLNLRDMTPPEWLETTDANVRASFASRGSIAYRKEYCTRSGGRVPVQIVLCWSEALEDEALAFMVDLSEQKRAEQEIHAMEQRLGEALKAAQAGVWERDMKTGALVWSDELRELYRLPPGTPVSSEMWESLIAPEHRESVLRSIEAALYGERYDVKFRAILGGRSVWLRSKGLCQFDEQGRPLRFTGITMDVTSQMEMEEELGAVNRRLRSHLENSPLAVIEWDSSFQVTKWAGAAEEMFGWSEEEILGKNLGDWPFIHEDDEAGVRDVGLNLLRNHPDGTFSANRNCTKDGRVLHCEWYNSALLGDDGRVESILSLVLDVTEQTLTNRALLESEERYRTLVESIPGLVFTTDENGFNVFVNSRFEEFTGISAQELHHEGWLQALHPDDRIRAAAAWQGSVKAGRPYQVEFRIRRHDGVYLWFLARGVPVCNEQGHIGSWIGVCTEIDKQKKIKDRLESLVLNRTKALAETVSQLEGALAEKTVLLKEVHHRVKNNLAVIASLLSRQAESSDHPVAVRNLEDSRRRVQAMALVHEHLYSTDQFDRVNFADYIQSFVGDLRAAMVPDSTHIRLVIEAEPIHLGVNLAIPCALIVNELVTNAFKYAFPGDRRGEVRVSFGALPGNFVALIVQDNGVGLPDGIQWPQTRSLGLKIVRLLAKQIDARLDVQTVGGTSFRLEFPASGG